MKIRFEIGAVVNDDVDEPVPELLERLLRLVQSTGSLSAATRGANISYRTGWNLVNHWAGVFDTALLHKSRGQGARLSEFSEKFLGALDTTRQKTSDARILVADQLSIEAGKLLSADAGTALVLRASHCISHNILRDLYNAQDHYEIEISHSGSGRSLKLLESGECDVAGFHLADGTLRQLFRSEYSGLIKTVDIKVIEAVKRQQGLIVQKNNPKNIRKITDLINPEVRLVNRQPDSGTRILLDVLLRRHGIDGKKIAGYDNEEFTHSAVSALVAGKSADVAVGTEATAIQFDLDFLPLVTETYFYGVHRDNWERPQVQALVAVLSSANWKHQVNKLRGYDAKQAGTVYPAQSVLG